MNGQGRSAQPGSHEIKDDQARGVPEPACAAAEPIGQEGGEEVPDLAPVRG
jgi:hypothetical protein